MSLLKIEEEAFIASLDLEENLYEGMIKERINPWRV